MTRDGLTLFYAPGCHVCADTKPQIARLQAALPKLRIDRVNIEEVTETLDQPILVIPAFELRFKGRKHFVDAEHLAKDFELPLTAEGIASWVKQTLQQED